MALPQTPQTEEARRGDAATITWKDKVDKALAARSLGKELRKDKKQPLSTRMGTKL